MNENKNSNIHLRPRFKMEFNENVQNLLSKFKDAISDKSCRYYCKVVGNHIVIDISVEENHFWSPQLNIEIEEADDKKSIVKGLFGPKPQVWTLFMFFHFAVAVAFIGFLIMTYVKWTLKEDYSIALLMVILLPVLWILMYFFGRIGKKTGHQQMDELYEFMMSTLKK